MLETCWGHSWVVYIAGLYIDLIGQLGSGGQQSLPVVHNCRQLQRGLGFPWLVPAQEAVLAVMTVKQRKVHTKSPPGTAACRLPPADPCSWQSWLQQ